MALGHNKPSPRDLIVTGIPRGGTTLLAALINSCPDAICLSEPDLALAVQAQAGDAQDYVARLIGAYAECRARIAAGEPLHDNRMADGQVVTNYLGPRREDGAPRERLTRQTQFQIAPRSDAFVLGMKHMGLFIGVLPELAASAAFETAAVVRHPAEVFASWLTTSFPPSKGQLTGAEKFWPTAVSIRNTTGSLPRRIALLYDAIFNRIVEAKVDHLFRYEEIVARPENLFASLAIAMGNTNLATAQASPVPDDVSEAALIELRVLRGAVSDFYSF